MAQQQQPWHLTVIRLEGMRLMRPERSWRPIVTVEIDQHYTHETILGVDGQNVNQKETFSFDEVEFSSEFKVEVWQRSQSKKKSKKRNLVGSSESFSLGRLLKKQDHEQKLDIQLKCRVNGSVSRGGKPQDGTFLRIRLRPPLHIIKQRSMAESGYDYSTGNLVDIDSTSVCSFDPPQTPITPITPENYQPPITVQAIRRRPIRGYRINSDNDCYIDEDRHFTNSKPTFDEPDSFTCVDEDTFTDPANIEAGTPAIPQAQLSINSCLAFSLLPTCTEQVVEPPPLTRLERVFASFTIYSKLKAANTEVDFEQVFACLMAEWKFIGGLLVALAAFDTAVFSINSGSLFTVDSHARNAIVTSSMVSGLGIACDAWFFLRYYWADPPTSIACAQDVYDTYFFFSLSARVPALCAFISAFCLMIFLSCVAFNASPYSVIVVCFIFGVVVSLQFLVFGVHWCTTRVVEGVSTSARAVARVVRGVME